MLNTLKHLQELWGTNPQLDLPPDRSASTHKQNPSLCVISVAITSPTKHYSTPLHCNQLQLAFLLFTGRDLNEESLDQSALLSCLQDQLLLKTEPGY